MTAQLRFKKLTLGHDHHLAVHHVAVAALIRTVTPGAMQ